MGELDEIREKKMKELEKKLLKNKLAVDKPIEVTDKNFDQMIKDNPRVVVDFGAEWCMPCHMVAPVVEELAKEFAGKVTFGKMDVDQNRKTPMKFGVAAIPTLILFKNAKAADQVVGALPKQQLKERIQKLLG